MDLAQIRRLAIIAMFSDDELLSQLTLKGGNALNLVYLSGCPSIWWMWTSPSNKISAILKTHERESFGH